MIILALLSNRSHIPGTAGLGSQADTGRCQAAISYGYTSRRVTSSATITHSHFRSRSSISSITTTITTVTCLCIQRQSPCLHIAPNSQLQLCFTATAASTSYNITLSSLITTVTAFCPLHFYTYSFTGIINSQGATKACSAAVTASAAGIISTAAGSTVCTITTSHTNVNAVRDTDIFPDIIGAVISVGCRPGCTSPQVQAASRYDRHGQYGMGHLFCQYLFSTHFHPSSLYFSNLIYLYFLLKSLKIFIPQQVFQYCFVI